MLNEHKVNELKKGLKAALENKEPDSEMKKLILPINPGPMYIENSQDDDTE